MPVIIIRNNSTWYNNVSGIFLVMVSRENDFNNSLPRLRENRHLQLALNHTSTSWLPVNSELLKSIREKAADGAYRESPEQFLSEVKQDFGLFMHCLKDLAELLNKNRAAKETFRPVDAFLSLDETAISSLLEAMTNKVNMPALDDGEPEQYRQLERSMTSAAVAETIADEQTVSSDQVFTCALMRQLGETLVAWNYPGIYKSATISKRAEESLDETLNRLLGFSPTLLGISVARQWKLAPEMRRAMGDKELAPHVAQKPEVEAAAQTFEKLCHIGEVFANQLDPARQAPQEEWNMARIFIERAIGKEGIHLISDRVKLYCGHYTRLHPEIFSVKAEDLKALFNDNLKSDTILRSNRHLPYCPAKLRSKLQQLYKGLEGGAVSRDKIEKLIKVIIPEAGFARGCIYLIDPASHCLMPRLSIGYSKLSEFRKITISPDAESFDPVLAAYRSLAPVMEEGVLIDSQRTTYIAGVLGDIQKAGVLYLELSTAASSDPEMNPLLLFKALRQTLGDCLNLF